jgi:hypothetical protein
VNAITCIAPRRRQPLAELSQQQRADLLAAFLKLVAQFPNVEELTIRFPDGELECINVAMCRWG